MIIAIILILLLSVSLFFGAQKRQQSQKVDNFTQKYEEALRLLDQGEALALLDPAQSREVLFQAQGKVAEAEALALETEKITDLKTKIQTALDKVYKEYKLTDLPLFLDLTLITAEGRGDKLALNQQYLAVLDTQKSRLWGVNTSRKSTEVLTGGGTIDQAKGLFIDSDYAYVLEKEGLAQIKVSNKKLQRGFLKEDPEWGNIGSLKMYNGYLYLLDPDKKQIWRYAPTESGLGNKQAWFKDESPKVEDVTAMSVDGSIWLLKEDGTILKFTQGISDSFAVSGLSKPLSLPKALYTDVDTRSLYILDSGNKRLVVLSKAGQYEAEYSWEGMDQITDLAVRESEKRIYLLGGSKIYELELR